MPFYRRLFDEYPQLNTDVNTNIKTAIASNTYRNPVPYNNSSRMATALDPFMEEEKIYMRLLVISNFKSCLPQIPLRNSFVFPNDNQPLPPQQPQRQTQPQLKKA